MIRTIRLAAALLAASALGAHAASIEVTTLSAGTGGPDCTLRDAVTASNADLATGGCAAGSGPDVIVLPVDGTITFAAADNVDAFFGSNALPVVTADLTIDGRGTTLLRDPTLPCTISAVPDAGEFRFLRIVTGVVTLRDLELRNGCLDAQFPASGGAISAGVGTLTLERVVLRDNDASAGGALQAGGALVVVDSEFAFNTAQQSAGALQALATFDISGTSFHANSAAQISGGAIQFSALPFPPGAVATGRIRNTTFSGNSAPNGAAIFVQDSVRLELSHATIAQNTGATGAALAGSMIPFPGAIAPVVAARGVWITDNAPANCIASIPPFGVTFQAEGVNLSSDGSCTGFTPTTAGQLDPLALTAGLTPTHRPQPGSSGIDAAGGCFQLGGTIPLATDQRGRARPLDGNASGTAECDVGAVELDLGLPPVLTVPATAVTLSDQPLLFGVSFGNAIGYTDPDAALAPVRLSLEVDHGTLSLASVAGLTFAIGDGTADTTMQLEGPLAAIALALDGLAYTPFPGYTGPDSLELVANDLGNTGEGVPQTDMASVALTVAVRMAIASIAPGSLAFGNVGVEAGPSAPRSLVLTNTGNVALTGIVFEIAPPEFSQTNDCGASLAPLASCAVAVRFDPASGGARLGVLAVSSNAPTSPNGVVLTGSGQGDALFSDGFE